MNIYRNLLFLVACVVSASVVASPAYRPGHYDTPGSIFDAVYGFRTVTGKPLESMLGAYGLHIEAVDVVTVESLGPRNGDHPGDVVYDLTLAGKLTKKLPCSLGVAGQDMSKALEEVIRRKGRFPVINVELQSTGPILLWFATGKCPSA